MVVDFHTHIFPDKIAEKTIKILESKANYQFKPYYLGDKEGLLKMLNDSGVDVAVVLPVVTNPKQFDSVNEFAKNLNDEFLGKNKRIISFAGIHPKCDNIEEKMQFIKSKNFLGVKIHPDYQETFIDDDGYIKILECAKKLDLVVVTHSGVDVGYLDAPVRCTPDRLLRVIDIVKPKKFVLGHFGANRFWQEVYEKLAGKDVYFDTAFTLNFIEKDLFKNIIKKHGDDKILFATDAPWQDMKDNLQKIKSFNLGSKTLNKILFENACKLLKMDE